MARTSADIRWSVTRPPEEPYRYMDRASNDLTQAARTVARRVACLAWGSPGFEWLPRSMGKRSIRWRHGGLQLVLQVRPPVAWYEPVAEACACWSRSGGSTLRLLASGLLADGSRFYVFPYIEGRSAAEALGELSSRQRHGFAERIGAAFARLNTVPTSEFGEFRYGLNGTRATWFNFLEGRANEALAELLGRGLVADRDRVAAMDRIEPARKLQISPRLLYVDVKLDNVVIPAGTDAFVIIDYDYLLSGDPMFSGARMRPFYGSPSIAEPLMAGFFSVLGPLDIDVLRAYETLHTLELLRTPTQSTELRLRSQRLVRLLGQLLASSGR
jgi:hypothetical protein